MKKNEHLRNKNSCTAFTMLLCGTHHRKVSLQQVIYFMWKTFLQLWTLKIKSHCTRSWRKCIEALRIKTVNSGMLLPLLTRGLEPELWTGIYGHGPEKPEDTSPATRPLPSPQLPFPLYPFLPSRPFYSLYTQSTCRYNVPPGPFSSPYEYIATLPHHPEKLYAHCSLLGIRNLLRFVFVFVSFPCPFPINQQPLPFPLPIIQLPLPCPLPIIHLPYSCLLPFPSSS